MREFGVPAVAMEPGDVATTSLGFFGAATGAVTDTSFFIAAFC